MGTAAFYIFYGINWIVTLLPLRILYVLSDILYLFLYYFPSYRRNVVATNLRNSFPGKTNEELVAIEKKFYRHLADIFIETLKLTHLSNKELMKRVTFRNPELLNDLFEKGRDLIIVHSHYNNWEWLCILPVYTMHKNVPVYKPLHNKLFERFINNLRSRNNAKLTPMSHVIREIVENKENNSRALYGIMSDQTPAKSDIRYWTRFLNQDTPVYLGIEKIAARYNMPVIFFNVRKIKRGYYEITAELLFEDTAGLPKNYVTDAHVARLETLITENPEYWIWTHKRWKHTKPADNA